VFLSRAVFASTKETFPNWVVECSVCSQAASACSKRGGKSRKEAVRRFQICATLKPLSSIQHAILKGHNIQWSIVPSVCCAPFWNESIKWDESLYSMAIEHNNPLCGHLLVEQSHFTYTLTHYGHKVNRSSQCTRWFALNKRCCSQKSLELIPYLELLHNALRNTLTLLPKFWRRTFTSLPLDPSVVSSLEETYKHFCHYIM